MSGRVPVKIYQYSLDGKYLRTFNTMIEAFNYYYDNGTKGRLMENNATIRLMPDDTVICKDRIGRDRIRKEVKILNSKYCGFYNSSHANRSFSIYNLKNEKLATFNNIQVCSVLTGIDQSTINSALSRSTNASKGELVFRYD